MKILSIDLGSYKTVLASSDTSAGEVILNETGGRSTKMAIDYRNKTRIFGNVNVSCKDREQVAESIRSEIDALADEMIKKGTEKVNIPRKSHVYALLNHVIIHYATTRGISINQLEIEIIVPETYTQLHKNILIKILELINPKMEVQCISDSVALCAYYASKRPSEETTPVVFVDVGHSKSTLTAAYIRNEEISIVKKATLNVGGQAITEHLIKKIYSGVDKNIPELFSQEEFTIRNLKKIEWIKAAILGLTSVTAQVDISYDRSIDVTIRKDDIEEVAGAFAELGPRVQDMINTLNNTSSEQEVNIEMTGGSSKIFFIEEIIRNIIGKKPNVHLNADESVALGGVYRRLMESPFHRFRYDPVIRDTISYSYNIAILSNDAAPRSIMVFKEGTSFVKDKKLKIVGKKHDPSIVLEQCPRKTVQITKITEASQIILLSGNCPVYSLKLKEPAAAEPSEDGKEAPKKPKNTDSQRTVKMIMSLTSDGGVEISSEDVEMVSLVDMLNTASLKNAEDTYLSKERAIREIEAKINTIQAGIYNAIELLSDSLACLPSAEKVTESLWEYSQTIETMASTAKSMQEVIAFEEGLDKNVPLESEWAEHIRKHIAIQMEKYSVELRPLPYPGIINLYNVDARIQSETLKELERKERQRQYEEERKKREEERQRQIVEQAKMAEQEAQADANEQKVQEENQQPSK
ncbi:heat shock 70kDa protein 4 [Nematocida sp. ERTm5]|nr:heat shock 70kDa protein 4 [Nematocida sp. ERTm5]